MRICMCCKQTDIKPTFSSYCRFCNNHLQQKYGIDVTDYKTYFKIIYNKRAHVEDSSKKQ